LAELSISFMHIDIPLSMVPDTSQRGRNTVSIPEVYSLTTQSKQRTTEKIGLKMK